MSSPDVKGEVHLRPYQTDAITRAYNLAAAGARRLLIVAPTGAGKSVIAGRMIANAITRDESILVVAHRRELINQLFAKIVDAGVDASLVGVLMANDSRRRPNAPVQVASIDTLRRRPKPAASVVIVDEAHRELAKSYADMRAYYPNALHLGFTATPYRADNRGLGEFYEDLVVVASVSSLIDLGFLVEPRVFTVPDGQQPNLAGVRVRGGDYDHRDLDSAMDQQPLVGNIVEHWEKHARGVRTVAFAVSVKHSKHIVDSFRAKGVAAEHLDGMTPTLERDAILARLDRGETLVVSNCGVLCEGWDQPAVKCAVLARPTKSTGLYLQQAGRILRPWQGVRAVILDHAGCAREHGLPQEEREFSLEPKPKRKRGEVVEVPIRFCTNCQAVLPARMRVCPECGFIFAETRALPHEVDGDLVEAKRGDKRASTEDENVAPQPRAKRDRAFQRTAYEQLRALARAKKKDDAWVAATYAERYGAPPPREWVEHGWGGL